MKISDVLCEVVQDSTAGEYWTYVGSTASMKQAISAERIFVQIGFLARFETRNTYGITSFSLFIAVRRT